MLSGGDLPSVSLLVTEELEEGKRVTHRLASLLGFAISEDMYPDTIQVIWASDFSQSAHRKGPPNKNPYRAAARACKLKNP